jgi:hypothetical protein
VAFSLMMCAYSLRTWRRNGVACDELLFLPGTAHGQNNGIDSPLIELPQQQQQQQPPTLEQQPLQQEQQSQNRSPEGDVAAGGFSRSTNLSRNSSRSFRQRRMEMAGIESSVSSDSSELIEGILKDVPEQNEEEEPFQVDPNNSGQEDNDEQQGLGLLETNTNARPTSPPTTGGTRLERWTNNHPLVTRLGTFFFFRNSNTTTQSATYAPSGPTVFGAALDLSMPVLFNFHLFIEAYNHMQSQGDEIPAKILPLIFLSVLIVRTMVPPSKRGRFWGTLKFTFTAPLHRVRFRDDFIGDVLTSMVRPSQDLFFALSYYCTVIWGTVSGTYGLTESGELLEQSFLLHNVILPSCAILPLWWKYLQTLRQAHDANRRWPYQGNSLKYLTSSLVIIYGITHPEDRRSSWWLCFCFLTLGYQIFWDVMMDWELFEIAPDDRFISAEQDPWWFAQISSLRPSSRILLALQMYILQPMLNTYSRLRASTPSWRQIQLRSKRLYKTESFYWKIFFFNVLMRFTWMLCFVPAYHFNGGKRTVSSSSDVNSYLGVLLPVAEIVRRTLWGFLTLERETLRMMDSDVMYSRVEVDEEEEDDNSKTETRSFRTQLLLPTWLDNQQQVAHDAATSNAKQRVQFMRHLFVVEIYVWAFAFVVLGCWAAS